MTSWGKTVAAIGFMTVFVSGFLRWFVVHQSAYTLVDGLQIMLNFASGGPSSAATNSGLGAMLTTASMSYPVLLVSFAFVLVFWPAMLVAGLVEIFGKRIRPHPGIYGMMGLTMAAFFAQSMTVDLGSSVGLGAGFYLSAIAVALFFLAYFLYKGASKTTKAVKQQSQTKRVQQPLAGVA